MTRTIRIPVTLDVVGTEEEIRRWATGDFRGMELLHEDRRKCAAVCRAWVDKNPAPVTKAQALAALGLTDREVRLTAHGVVSLNVSDKIAAACREAVDR